MAEDDSATVTTNSPTTNSHKRTPSEIPNNLLQQNEKDATVIDISSQPPCDSSETLAIQLKSAYKHYGSGKNRLPVLIGLNMNVPKGQIYGLLGKISTLMVKSCKSTMW